MSGGNKKLNVFDDCISIKMEPELRHVLAHLYYAIEASIKGCPVGALDNLKSIEGLVMFEGDDWDDWEKYYSDFKEWKEVRDMACKGGKKKCKGKGTKKCKGKGGRK